MRVIKHPLFRPFNSTQAEEFLGIPEAMILAPTRWVTNLILA
jgi:hypothetical protein